MAEASDTVQVAFRLPAALVAALDAEAAEAAASSPLGVRVTRTDVVRGLLVDALARRIARKDRARARVGGGDV